MASFDAIADLPLEIESCELEGLEIVARRVRTADHDRQAARRRRTRGSAKTSSTTPSTTSPSRATGRLTGLAGSDTFAEFSEHLDGIDLFPAGAPVAARSPRDYRRWAFESAALDLALRQAGTNLAEALGREPRPLNFVNSMRLARLRRATSTPRSSRCAHASPSTRPCASSSTRSMTGTTS